MAGYFDSVRPSDYISEGLGQIGGGLSSLGGTMAHNEEQTRAPADPLDIQAWIDRLGPEKIQEIANHPGDIAELVARDRQQSAPQGFRAGPQGTMPRGEMGPSSALPDMLSVGDGRSVEAAPQGLQGLARNELSGYMVPGGRSTAAPVRPPQVSAANAPSPARPQTQAPAQASAQAPQAPRGDWTKIQNRDMPYVEKAMVLQQSRDANQSRESNKDKDIAAKFGLKQYEQSQINERFGEKNIREWAKLDQQDGANRIKTAVDLEKMRNSLEIALIAAKAKKDKTGEDNTIKYLAVIAGLQGKLGSSMNLADDKEVQNMLRTIAGHVSQTSQLIEPTLGMPKMTQPAATGPAKPKASSAAPQAGGSVRMRFPNGSEHSVPADKVEDAKTRKGGEVI